AGVAGAGSSVLAGDGAVLACDTGCTISGRLPSPCHAAAATPATASTASAPSTTAVPRRRGAVSGSGVTSSVEGCAGGALAIGDGCDDPCASGGDDDDATIDSHSNGGGVPRSSRMTARTSTGDGRFDAVLD